VSAPRDHDPFGDAVGDAIRAAATRVEAPPALRERLEADRARAATRRRRRWRVGGATGALAAVAAVIVALVTGGPGAPSLAQASEIALRPPTAGAPAVDPHDPRFVQVQVGGVRFPNLGGEYRSHWKAVGQRRDEVGDRHARTVVYDVAGAGRVGYPVLDGTALAIPKGTPWVTRGDTPVAVVRDGGGRAVLVWNRRGQTCILASRGLTVAQLLSFFGT
jgi:hypothetical protein